MRPAYTVALHRRGPDPETALSDKFTDQPALGQDVAFSLNGGAAGAGPLDGKR